MAVLSLPEQIPLQSGMVTSISALALLAVALYLLRQWALPRPLPGIPYNACSAKRILGDVPLVLKAGGRRAFIASQPAKHNSPIVQLFLWPLGNPVILISDYREQVDICLRRTREFDRSYMNRHLFGAVIPEHHITMKTTDKRFKGNRDLVRDLMTPRFLNDVSAPQIYQKVLTLIELWDLKAQLSKGRPFSAGADIWGSALDIIIAVSFGLNDSQSTMRQQLEHLKSLNVPLNVPGGPDEPYIFPANPVPEELAAFVTVSDSIGIMFQSPFPRLAHWLYRWTPTWRKANKLKWQLSTREIRKSVTRIESGDTTTRNAMDQILLREKAIAEKEGRQPNYERRTIHDELLGYLIGGHDTTSTTLKWGLKHLTLSPSTQSRLRRSLHASFPLAHAEARNPTVSELLKTPLPYLDAVVEETLRLALTLPVALREAIVDTTILGTPIPKGTQVFIASSASSFLQPTIAVDERLRTEGARKAYAEGGAAKRGDWDPETMGLFVPERWLRKRSKSGENEGEGDDNDDEFVPNAGPMLAFGAGPRACFGKRLAYLELRIAMALLVWNFEFLPLERQELNSMEFTETLTTQPKVCFVRLRRVGAGGDSEKDG